MNMLYIVLPLALCIGAAFVWAFVAAARKGQFDDLDTPAMRALFDDTPVKPSGAECEVLEAESNADSGCRDR